jgi:hypothetical protein
MHSNLHFFTSRSTPSNESSFRRTWLRRSLLSASSLTCGQEVTLSVPVGELDDLMIMVAQVRRRLSRGHAALPLGLLAQNLDERHSCP